MDAESQRFRRITMKVLTMQLNSTTVMDIVAYGGAAVGMILALGQFMAGSLSFRGTLMILLLAAEFFLPLRLLGSFFHIAMNGMAASDKIFALLDLPEPEQGTEEIREERPDIRIQDLRFSYEKDREISAWGGSGFPIRKPDRPGGGFRLRKKHHRRPAGRQKPGLFRQYFHRGKGAFPGF